MHAAFLYNIAEPLRGVLRLASFRGSPMPVGVALRIAYDVVLGARALEACGASPALGESLSGGLIPDSVLVGHDGRSRLCDAGIGAILRRTNEYGQHPDLLSYAAPEQLEGGGIIDGRWIYLRLAYSFGRCWPIAAYSQPIRRTRSLTNFGISWCRRSIRSSAGDRTASAGRS